ncbi:hypothetical protein BGZ47_010842 [Haplosporangium gracile]|nr:hypothetical protein BGZ47_010842 [Haplosporangium gracile]
MDPVIIVGAGLGGLLLALLLDQVPTSIPYTILERSTERKWPLEGGGVIFLTPQIHPLLARLGILEALREISRPVAALTVYEYRQYAKAAASLDSVGGNGAGSTFPQAGSMSGSWSGSAGSGSEPKRSGFGGDGDDDGDGVLFSKSRYDYDTLAISRPELYNFLVDRIPEEKLVLGKQVQELVFQDIAHDERSAAPVPVPVPGTRSNRKSSGGRGTEPEAEEVGAERAGAIMMTMPLMDNHSGSDPSTSNIAAAVVCSDGSRYEGIIIGADGAYSTIRLSLYQHLRERGLLTTAADKEDSNENHHHHGHGPMRAKFRVLVGQTRELDPDRFELLKNEYSDVRVLVSQGVYPFAFWCVPMTGNKICWMLEEKLTDEQICPEIEDFTQDQLAISRLCASVRSIPSSYQEGGVTVGEIILDSTPEGTAALLLREEGYFSTWAHGNIALMGDACHKLYLA